MTVNYGFWHDYVAFFVCKLVTAPFFDPLKTLWAVWEVSAGLAAASVFGAVLFRLRRVRRANHTFPVGIGEVAASSTVVA